VSQTAALLLLFVVLPLIVTPLVVWIVVQRAPDVPAGYRISELLDHGEEANAELIEWKNKGPFLFDSRPMIAYRLSVRTDGEPYELLVTQSTPRDVVARLEQGMTLQVRVSRDRQAGAIVLP
jgi:hypothetical protein